MASESPSPANTEVALEPLPVWQVTTKGGVVIRGLLRSRGSNGIILTNAQIQSEDTNRRVFFQKMDNEVIIPAENVEYIESGLDIAMLDQWVK